MENTAEYVYEKLKNTISPGKDIAGLYASLFGIDTGKSEIIMMNKLVKAFGRFTVFFSVIDMAGSYSDERIAEPYKLLYKICKSRFEKEHQTAFVPSHGSLDKYADNLHKETEELRKKKFKVPSSDGLKKKDEDA